MFPYHVSRGIDFGELLSPEVRAKHKDTIYDLVANIVHDGEPGSAKGTYRVHLLNKVWLLKFYSFNFCRLASNSLIIIIQRIWGCSTFLKLGFLFKVTNIKNNSSHIVFTLAIQDKLYMSRLLALSFLKTHYYDPFKCRYLIPQLYY